MTKQATEAAPRAAWCHQHHQPRADCLPGDRHVQSFRGADELLDAVKAKAEAMGLNRQDGIEMALEQFVGWHEPGERWRGPRSARGPRGRAGGPPVTPVPQKRAAVRNFGAEEWFTIAGRGELAVIAGLPEGDDIYDPRTLKGRRVVIDNAQCDVIGVEVTLGYEPTPSRPYRGSFGLLVRRA
jgi:hypothetical protein